MLHSLFIGEKIIVIRSTNKLKEGKFCTSSCTFLAN